jgi:hypothetical protein
MLNITKKKLYNYNDFFFLKNTNFFYKIYNTRYRINTFTKPNYYIFYNGRFFLQIKLNNFCVNTQIKQYVFSKKPFCGPVKKFKK